MQAVPNPEPGDAGRAREPQTACHPLGGEALLLRGPAVVSLPSGELAVRGAHDACVRMGEGDVLTLSAGETARLGGRDARGELLVFAAPPCWTDRALHLAGAAPVAAAPKLFLHRSGSDTARRAARILRELARRPAGGLETSARHLELLSIVLAPRAGFVDPRARENRRARARRTELLGVLDRLEHAPLEGVSLTSIARELGASERQTSRLFRAELSMTFREFMSRVRLKRAKALLRETGRPVIEVAAETGWRSLGHFTSTFRRRVGMTPSEYRAQRSSDPEETERAA